MAIFTICGSKQKILAIFGTAPTYRRLFYLERDMGYPNRPETFFGQYRLDLATLRPIFQWYPQISMSKIDFFSIFVKCFIDAIKYRIRVQNDFGTPQGSISGHISSFRPLSANIYKINFSEFLDFLRFFYLWVCCEIVVFLGTCHFWGTTAAFFKKFKLRAFRKVYGL